MQSFNAAGALINSGALVPLEVSNDSPSREELLEEVRALQILLRKTEQLLDAEQGRAFRLEKIQSAYRAALAACAQQEKINKELSNELKALKSLRSSSSAS